MFLNNADHIQVIFFKYITKIFPINNVSKYLCSIYYILSPIYAYKINLCMCIWLFFLF